MTATLLGRMDRLISFSQLCLGASVFAPVTNLQITGCLVVVVSSISLVYQPGLKAGLADFQKRQYQALLSRMSAMSEDELRESFRKTQEADSLELGSLARAADCGERIRLGHAPIYQLTKFEKLMAWAAGDLPSTT